MTMSTTTQMVKTYDDPNLKNNHKTEEDCMSQKGFIYKYTFPNGKVYIGQTRVSVRERNYQHIGASRDPKRWTPCERAIALHGEPVCETIETVEVEDNEGLKLSNLLDEAERKWIKHYDCTTASGKGYNVQEGGKLYPPQELLLQERWYEIFNEDQWGESIAYVKELLKSIGTKLCITKEKLTKEERSIWYGYKFREYELGQEGAETTFCSFYKNHQYIGDIGDVPYEDLETLNNENASREEKDRAKKIIDKCFFDQIMKSAVEEHWIEDIRQTIWKQVMKEKEKILRKYNIIVSKSKG